MIRDLIVIKVDAARRLLAQATTIEQAKRVVDLARAAEIYAQRQKLGREAADYAHAIQIDATRLLGDFLKANRPQPGRPREEGAKRPERRLSKPSTHRTVLADAGLSRNESSAAQFLSDLAEQSPDEFEAVRRNEKPIAGVRREHQRQQRVESFSSGRASTCEVADLQTLIIAGRRFRTIYADPPWPYDNQRTRASTQKHYRTASLEEIGNLPVGDLADVDCHLHLWTTNAFLPSAFAIIERWGFVYKSCFVWVKPDMGIGNYWRVSHEFLLLGVRGSAPFLQRNERSWTELPRGLHSVKPAAVRERIERVSPVPRLELFARELAPGWVCWGDEITRTLFTRQFASA